VNHQRIERINEEVRKELDQVIREEVSDPRIAGTFSITRVEVTNDLSHAKVYVSVLEEELRADMLKGLTQAAGFIRGCLGRRITLRHVPQLNFVKDENIAYGVHIAHVLKEIAVKEQQDDEPTEPE